MMTVYVVFEDTSADGTGAHIIGIFVEKGVAVALTIEPKQCRFVEAHKVYDLHTGRQYVANYPSCEI